MEITLTDTKKETLKTCCSKLLYKNNQTIRYVAKVIGLITSSLPGEKYGQRNIDKDKNKIKQMHLRYLKDALML